MVSRLTVAAGVTLGFYFASITFDSAQGQVVQLPSIETFSYSGSVLVPDSGTTSLGGRTSSATGVRSRLGNQAFGGSFGSSHASASVTIIDLQAMDQQMLQDKSRELPTNPHASVTLSERTELGKKWVRTARRELRAGNQSAAFEAYRKSLALLNGELRALAMAEFRRQFPLAASQVTGLSVP
jgi:hypothetical protein